MKTVTLPDGNVATVGHLGTFEVFSVGEGLWIVGYKGKVETFVGREAAERGARVWAAREAKKSKLGIAVSEIDIDPNEEK
jgi:hypothetical protein